MVPKDFRGNKEVRNAVRVLAGKMLEHGRDHWPKWTNERLGKVVTEGPPTGHLEVAFTDLERVISLLRDLKKEWIPHNRKMGYPISIVLTGLTGDTHDCCRKTGFKEHTYLHSLGTFGNTQNLPSEDELSLITMCGHGLIAKNRIRNLVREIQDGELTLEDAAEDIAKPCECGIGNKKRAMEIFARLAGKTISD
jgi:hypothetical protein